MQGKVEICGVNTSRLSVLDAERTRELLRRVRQGGPVRPGGADRRESAAGAQRDPALRRPGREHRRPVPGGLHRPHQGHRQLRLRGPRRAFFHLRRSAIMGWRNMRQTPTPSSSASSGQSAPLLRPFSLQYTKYSCGKAPSPEHGFSRNLLSPTGSSSA